MTDEDIIDQIVKHEGAAYTNVVGDRGGPTKYGITQATLSADRGKPVMAEDVANLTEAEARDIYRRRYVVAPGFDKIADTSLRAVLVDWGVNSGPGVAVRGLQRILKTPVDGVIGPITLLALPHLDQRRLYLQVCAMRVRFYGMLVTHDPTQAKFAEGWADRIADFIESA